MHEQRCCRRRRRSQGKPHFAEDLPRERVVQKRQAHARVDGTSFCVFSERDRDLARRNEVARRRKRNGIGWGRGGAPSSCFFFLSSSRDATARLFLFLSHPHTLFPFFLSLFLLLPNKQTNKKNSARPPFPPRPQEQPPQQLLPLLRERQRQSPPTAPTLTATTAPSSRRSTSTAPPHSPGASL